MCPVEKGEQRCQTIVCKPIVGGIAMLSPQEVYPLVLSWLQALEVCPHPTALRALTHLLVALLHGQSLRPSALMRALLSPTPVPARQRYTRVARASGPPVAHVRLADAASGAGRARAGAAERRGAGRCISRSTASAAGAGRRSRWAWCGEGAWCRWPGRYCPTPGRGGASRPRSARWWRRSPPPGRRGRRARRTWWPTAPSPASACSPRCAGRTGAGRSACARRCRSPSATSACACATCWSAPAPAAGKPGAGRTDTAARRWMRRWWSGAGCWCSRCVKGDLFLTH